MAMAAPMQVTRDGFRIRKVPTGYRVWQHEGGRWHPMCDAWPTREDARAWITAALERAA